MSVKTWGFENIPQGGGEVSRLNFLIGYPLAATITPLIDDTSYFRRYLNDNTVSTTPSTAYVPKTVADYDDLSYIRRYLNDN